MSEHPKKVLLLGAGMVTRPGVAYLLEKGCEVVVATRTVSKAEALVAGHPGGRALALDVRDQAVLAKLVADAHVVISLLPAPCHPRVAEACIAAGRHLVTTSYVSPEMKRLGPRAEQAGIVLFNEVGLDPGIDHMSAMKVIHQVVREGGRVTAFSSYCGGLPAPDANDNPWGYKFSWSPEAVLAAGLNAARWLERGVLKEVPGSELFEHHWPVDVPGVGRFEGYPNRDSLGYVDLYGLAHAETMFRGTLRYPGWSDTLRCVVALGLLDKTRRDDLGGRTHAEVLASLVPGAKPGTLRADLAHHLNLAEDAEPLHRLDWAGFLSDRPVGAVESLFDLVAQRLQAILPFQPGERDMIVLHHEFEALTAKGGRKRITSTLVDYGDPGGDSAMARTVSLPCAVITDLLLEGAYSVKGVQIPVQPVVYEPALAALEKKGIRCIEHEESA